MTFYDGIKLDSSYRENGEWRIADTSACSGDMDGELVFLKVILIVNVLFHEFMTVSMAYLDCGEKMSDSNRNIITKVFSESKRVSKC